MGKFKIKKKIFMVYIIIFSLIFFTACNIPLNYVASPDVNHLYWKDIDVEIIEISKRSWFTGTHHYCVNITAFSKEYNLTTEQTYKTNGSFRRPKQWEYNEGDIIKAELYSWKNNVTGEINRREINQIY